MHTAPKNMYYNSSSDSEPNQTHILPSHSRKMTKSATVEQSAPNKPPKLTAASGMTDPHLCTWFLTQRATLDVGTFTEYMTTLRSAWLESHWATKLHKKVLGSQQGSRTFYEWALDIQSLNTLLYRNPTHLSDVQLQSQLKANICNELTIPILRAKLADDLTLKEWIKEVKHLDDECLEDLASQRKIAEEIHKLSKRNTTTTNKTSSLSSKMYNASLPHLGSLMETECTLLMKHKGCFKCRKFYVSHQFKDCTSGVPDASSYKTLTENNTNAAKPKMKPVVAVRPVGAVMITPMLPSPR
ncbi:hypothetical protein BDR05DRAFT_943603 [Suillus weaverae]|nr:hypothetical protein BDR05DRAFT_943603 [Suillus weaverae]